MARPWRELRSSLPKKLFSDARAFRLAAKFWWTDRFHPESCPCYGCTPDKRYPELQLSLF
jgi:hypothetical protein